MVWITRTDKYLSDLTGLSSKEAVSTVLNTRVIPAWSPSTQKEFCKNFKPDGVVLPSTLSANHFS